MKTTITENVASVASTSLVLPLRLIDLDSPWLFGIGRDMTDEERANAERHGRDDNPPMSVLGVTSEGLAAVDGKDLAQLFVASPKMLAAIQRLEAACNAVHEVSGGTPQHEAMWLAQLEARDAITEAKGIPWENAIGHPAATTEAGKKQRPLSPSDGPTCSMAELPTDSDS